MECLGYLIFLKKGVFGVFYCLFFLCLVSLFIFDGGVVLLLMEGVLVNYFKLNGKIGVEEIIVGISYECLNLDWLLAVD